VQKRRDAEKAGRDYHTREEWLEIWSKPPHDAHVKAFHWFIERSHKDDAHVRDYKKQTRPWLGLPTAEGYRVRYKNDPVFRQSHSDRIAQRRTLNPKGWRLSQFIRLGFKGDELMEFKAEEMLGYSLNSLRDHLEDLMPDGMTWEQYLKAEVAIDHKRPVHTFNMLDPVEFRQCWALDNLEPLTATDNRKKLAQDVRWREAAE